MPLSLNLASINGPKFLGLAYPSEVGNKFTTIKGLTGGQANVRGWFRSMEIRRPQCEVRRRTDTGL